MNSKASQSSLTISIQDISHILFHKEFIFCLVCQQDINCATGVSQHILEDEHKENLQNLFQICMQDPFCDSTDPMYADLVDNSVIDISHAFTNDIRNIYQIDSNFSCLLCPKTVSSTGDTDHVKSDLMLQLKVKRDLHFDCMKSNYSWIYCRNKTSIFMMFYKSVTFCSLCKQIINCDECNAAIKHLESSQHQGKLNSMPLLCNLPDKLEPTSTHVSESIDVSNQDFRPLAVFETLHRNSGQSNASGTDTSNTEINHDDLDEMLQDPLTCPECGEVIEIFNDNADFSLLHHSQKHVDLSDANKDFDCQFHEDADYVCPVCLETIPVFNKNLGFSITCHFNENNHDIGLSSSDINNQSGFLDIVLSELPQEHQVHSSFFTLDRNIFCKLCSCFLQDSSNHVRLASELLTKHILGHYHSEQYKISSQQLTLAVVNYNKDIVTQSTLNTKSLFEGLANKNGIIKNNKDFIEVQKYLYLCKICQKHVCYSPNESILKRNFLLHFNLPSHKNNHKRERKGISNHTPACAQITNDNVQGKFTNVSTSSRSTSRRVLGVFQEVLLKIAENPDLADVKYIEYKSNKFFCRICKVTMSLSTCGSPVKDHILGLKHKKRIYSENIVNERAQYILKKLAKYSKIVNENLNYLDTLNGNYFCNICKELLMANSSLSHLKEHLNSKSHRTKVFRAVGSKN